MPDIRCLFGFHGWGSWSRLGVTLVRRHCARCPSSDGEILSRYKHRSWFQRRKYRAMLTELGMREDDA